MTEFILESTHRAELLEEFLVQYKRQISPIEFWNGVLEEDNVQVFVAFVVVGRRRLLLAAIPWYTVPSRYHMESAHG